MSFLQSYYYAYCPLEEREKNIYIDIQGKNTLIMPTKHLKLGIVYIDLNSKI